jgi:hypothetical protein
MNGVLIMMPSVPSYLPLLQSFDFVFGEFRFRVRGALMVAYLEVVAAVDDHDAVTLIGTCVIHIDCAFVFIDAKPAHENPCVGTPAQPSSRIL